MDEERRMLKPGTVLGQRYRIVSLAGRGGMGAVYLAEDLKLNGKKWAVKQFRRLPRESDSFIREAEMLIRLEHPCLPRIADYYPPDGEGIGYLVTDFIEGPTLAEWFERRERRVSEDEVVRLAVQLCDCFRYLHEREEPIIYRDLKPSNIMIDADKRLHLIDFGIARHFREGKEADTIPLGTIGFAAPEQLEGRQTDVRTDLYALGALMYFLLSKGTSYYVARKPMKEQCPHVRPELAQVVDRLLCRDPAGRYPSAAALEKDLAPIVEFRFDAAGA